MPSRDQVTAHMVSHFAPRVLQIPIYRPQDTGSKSARTLGESDAVNSLD